jgi:two-component system LytT family response regulator
MRPDIVFLDLKIGIQLIFEISKTSPITFKTIFTSKYIHVLDALEFIATDCLLKPLEVEQLKKALENDLTTFPYKKYTNKTISIQENNISNIKIALPNTNGYSMLDVGQITNCKARGSYTEIYLNKSQKIISSKNLRYYENLLSHHNFIRVHNSHLVNSNYIKEVFKTDGGYLILNCGKTISISKSRRKNVYTSLGI